MEYTTCTNVSAAGSCSPTDAVGRELFELAVMICLVAGVGSSSRAHDAAVDWWGGA